MKLIATIILSQTCAGHSDEACQEAARIAATPCAYEDDTDCYWHAGAFGNGSGQSFIAIGDARVMIDRPTADRLLNDNSIWSDPCK